MRAVLPFILCFLIANNTAAELISANGYTLNTETNIVTGGGLEWLQWNETENISIYDALGDGGIFAQEGWQLARKSHISDLFFAWGFREIEPSWDGYREYSWDGYSDINLLIATADQERVNEIFLFHRIFYDSLEPEGHLYSSALFGDNLSQYETYDLLGVSTSFYDAPGVKEVIGNAAIFTDFILGWEEQSSSESLALVRTARIADVPEPSSIAIFLMGLLGMIVRRISNAYGTAQTDSFL